MIRFLIASFVLMVTGFVVTEPVSAYAPQTSGSEGGKTLKWQSKEIVVSISEADFGSLSKQEFVSIVKKSFESWSDAAGISFKFRMDARSNVSSRKSGGDGVSLVTIAPTSENLLLFGERKTSVSAVTRLFFDANGRIAEADIVLNPTARFTTDGSTGSFDLGATITHEAGHFLGLGHSQITGATMHRHQGRNGTYTLPSTYARTLAEDDKAGARYLYGPDKNSGTDFGTIRGTLSTTDTEIDLAGIHVWLESAVTGSAVAGIETDSRGDFAINSIPKGNYRIIATGRHGGHLASPRRLVRIETREEAVVDLALEPGHEAKRVSSFGFNGQISTIAVPLEPGRSYIVFAQGRNLDPQRIRFECSSPGISVDSLSLTKHYPRGGDDVVSFEVSLSPMVGSGEYSFRLFEDDALVSYLPGVITVDDVKNPWYSAHF